MPARLSVPVLGALLGLTVLVAACSSGNSSAAGAGLHGLLATPTGRALFIQWTPSGTRVTGSIQSAYLSTDGASLRSESGDVTGTVSGSSVTLDASALSSTGAVSGSFEGSDLLLTIPEQNGNLTTVRFSPGTVAEYNAAVAPLREAATQTAARDQFVNTSEAHLHLVPPVFQASGTFRSKQGQEEVVTYGAPTSTADFETPIVQVLSWRNGQWTSIAIFGVGPRGWGFGPGVIKTLDLGRGSISFGVTAVQGAGDNYPAVVVSNFGGAWHLVRFDTPQAVWAYAISPIFSSGPSVTMQQIGDAGNCVSKMPYRFDPKKGAFIVAGPTTNDNTSSCGETG